MELLSICGSWFGLHNPKGQLLFVITVCPCSYFIRSKLCVTVHTAKLIIRIFHKPIFSHKQPVTTMSGNPSGDHLHFVCLNIILELWGQMQHLSQLQYFIEKRDLNLKLVFGINIIKVICPSINDTFDDLFILVIRRIYLQSRTAQVCFQIASHNYYNYSAITCKSCKIV